MSFLNSTTSVNTLISTIKTNFAKLLLSLLTAFAVVSNAITTISISAQTTGTTGGTTGKFGEALFKKTSDSIYDMISLITSFIVTPIAVIALVVLIIQIIWGMVSGENHNMGKKIGWAFSILVLVIVALYLGNNARSVFGNGN
jgi:Na+-translocating ferredoxin:NAD+ oxidoreductase RnfA subunit